MRLSRNVHYLLSSALPIELRPTPLGCHIILHLFPIHALPLYFSPHEATPDRHARRSTLCARSVVHMLSWISCLLDRVLELLSLRYVFLELPPLFAPFCRSMFSLPVRAIPRHLTPSHVPPFFIPF